MRVVHVISGIDPENGGPSMALHGLARAQVLESLGVDVVATWQRESIPEVARRWRDDGIPVHLIGPASGRLLRHPSIDARLKELIGEADVVHIHALWEEIQHRAALIARAFGVPYIIRPCGMLDPWSLAQNKLLKKAYMAWRLRRNLNRAAALHFTAEAEAELTGALRLRVPSIVEPNGVDLAEFADPLPLGVFRDRYRIDPGLRIALFLGRIHKKKGLDLLVPAFAQANLKDAVLVIAGPDDQGYGDVVRSLVQTCGLNDRVIFTGMLRGRDRVAAFADADLFVLPSYSENFGVAVVESLAAGTPVIISDQVNIYREIAEGGVGGVVPLDMSILANELARWFGDETLRKAAACRARGFVTTRYDWRQIASRWIGHYERLVQMTSSAA